MAARKKKSGSRRPAAKKKAAKTAKSRVVAKKKAAKAPKRRVAAKKPVRAAKKPVAIVRANLRELVDQAASSAGAANEELLSQRIAEQEERLRRLRQEREQIPEEPE